MATDSYHHGVRVLELNEGTRPIRTVSTAVIGLVATAEDADAAALPSILQSLRQISKQLWIKQVKRNTCTFFTSHCRPNQCSHCNCTCRPKTTEAEQNSAIIGGVENGRYTGMKALLAAEQNLKVRPRILGVPGLDTAPVATALNSIAEKLRAFNYLSCFGCETKEEAAAYREAIGAREAMLIYPDF